MGCCASKEQEDAVITKGGEAAAFTGAVAGGAAIGAAISGPAAPIGAAVGGVVGAIVGKATAGTVGKVVSVPVGMLNDVWRGLLNRQEVLELLPDIGMLKTERAVYPPAMSDLSSTNSYLYQTHGTAIAGLPYMQALRGEPLTDAQRKSLSLAVRRLEAKKVVAITGDCGAMLHYQHQVAALSTRPVLLSALLQAPLLATTFKSDEQARRPPPARLRPLPARSTATSHRSRTHASQVLVITSDKTVTTDAVLKSLLLKTGLPTHALERFPLLGCEHIEGFRSSALAGGEGARIDPEATMAALLLMVRSAVASQVRGRRSRPEGCGGRPRRQHLLRPPRLRLRPQRAPRPCLLSAAEHPRSAPREHDAARLRRRAPQGAEHPRLRLDDARGHGAQGHDRQPALRRLLRPQVRPRETKPSRRLAGVAARRVAAAAVAGNPRDLAARRLAACPTPHPSPLGPGAGRSNAPTARLKPEELPGIGIMRIDYTYPPAMGDAAQ